jgi:hypothetical protein
MREQQPGISKFNRNSDEVRNMNTQKKSSCSDQGEATRLSIPERCIRERAYEIYVQRGLKGGHAEGDWLTAEAELKDLKKRAAELLSTVESLTGPA